MTDPLIFEVAQIELLGKLFDSLGESGVLFVETKVASTFFFKLRFHLSQKQYLFLVFLLFESGLMGTFCASLRSTDNTKKKHKPRPHVSHFVFDNDAGKVWEVEGRIIN